VYGTLYDIASTVSNGNRSREAIARAALEIVDREGLDALSMRRLAAELDMGTMTLYGYFRTKGDLLEAVIEEAAAWPRVPEPEGPWEERLRRLAHRMRQGLTRHRSLIEVRLRRPIAGPKSLRGTEVGIRALMDAGFDRAEAARAFRVIFLYVFGFVAFSDPEPEVTDERRRVQVAVAAALPPDELPLLSEMGVEMAEAMGGDEQFEYGLDAVLAGIAARLPR
jgi:AcrR family transcriptional regulator